MKYSLAILALCLFAFTATAQTDEAETSETTKIEERVAKLKEDLSLTADQESKLREAMTVQVEGLREQKMKIREAEKAMKEINRGYHESLKGFLSEDQLSKLREMKPSPEERQSKEKEKPAKGGKH